MEDGKEALLRSLSFLVRLLGEPFGLRNRAEIIVLIGVARFSGGAARRDEKPSQIPVRGALPPSQPFLGQSVSRPGPNEIQLQCLD